MAAPIVPPAIPLTIQRIDQALALAQSQITWRSPLDREVIRAVIDDLLDQRNEITGRT